MGQVIRHDGAVEAGPAGANDSDAAGNSGSTADGPPADFRTGIRSGGSSGENIASASIPASTTVQTAWRAAALFTRRTRIAAAAAANKTSDRRVTLSRCNRTSGISLLLPGFAARDALGQTLQFAFVHDVVVDHAKEQGLDRAAAETLDDLTDGLGGDVLRRIAAAVDVGAAVDGVVHVALLLEALEDG